MLLEEFLGVGLENFPRRVGDDGVEAAAFIEDFVEFEAPVEGLQGLDVGDGEIALFRLAFLAFGAVPGGFFKADAGFTPLIEQ